MIFRGVSVITLFVFVIRLRRLLFLLSKWTIFSEVIHKSWLKRKTILSKILWPNIWKNQNTFLGLKLHIRERNVSFSEKYALDLLYKTNLLGCKPVSTPMKVDMDFRVMVVKFMMMLRNIKNIIKKLIYLTVVRPKNSLLLDYWVKFINKPREIH